MMEEDRAVLSRFDAIWSRVQPGAAPAAHDRPDDAQTLRRMIDRTAAAAKVLLALSQREPCHAQRLKTLSCRRMVMARQLQGAYYLLTGERFAPGESCAVRHESAACLRCLWLAGRSQSAEAKSAAGETQEPLLQMLYGELAALLDDQCAALQEILCAVLG